MKKLTLILLLVCMLPKGTYGQTTDDALLRNRLESYFSHYKPIGAQFSRAPICLHAKLILLRETSRYWPMRRLPNRHSRRSR